MQAAQQLSSMHQRSSAPVDVEAVSHALTAAVPAQVVVLTIPAAAEHDSNPAAQRSRHAWRSFNTYRCDAYDMTSLPES
jgi:uncharacterized membrane protein YgcG